MRAYKRVTYHGATMNARTMAMVKEAERRLGYELTIIQGSYHQGVGASAGTHDGGGALDLAPFDHERKVKVLRQIGFAAWHRPELWINGKRIWGEHIHCIAIGDKELSPAAKNQVAAYYAGRDGLAGNGPDNAWRPNPIPVFAYWKTFVASIATAKNQFKAKKPTSRFTVKMIQRALNAKNNAGLKVDGIAGEKTRQAYMRFEKSLGYKHPDANPGLHSLRKLGLSFFRVKKG